MNIGSIAALVDRTIEEGYAIDNVAFGMGGGLLQQVNRDTLRFAMKENGMRDDAGLWRDVCKASGPDRSDGTC